MKKRSLIFGLASLSLFSCCPLSAKAQAIKSALIVSGPVQDSYVASQAPIWTNPETTPVKIFKIFIAMLPESGAYECGMVVRRADTRDLMCTGYWPSNGVDVEAGYWLVAEDTFSPNYFELPVGGQLSVYCYSFGGVTTASCEVWYTQ